MQVFFFVCKYQKIAFLLFFIGLYHGFACILWTRADGRISQLLYIWGFYLVGHGSVASIPELCISHSNAVDKACNRWWITIGEPGIQIIQELSPKLTEHTVADDNDTGWDNDEKDDGQSADDNCKKLDAVKAALAYGE